MLVNIYEAKAKLSSLVDASLKGEEIIIGKKGVPMVSLQPVNARPQKRVFGKHKGQIAINGDINATMEEDFMAHFE